MNPKLPLAHAVRALFLITCARFDEALAEARTARDLDPLSLFTNMGVAWVHHFAGDHEEAIRQALRTRDLAPALEEAGNILIASYELLGRYDEAAQMIAGQRCWGFTLDGTELREAFRRGGPEAYWRNRLEQMRQTEAVAVPAMRLGFAIAHAHVGDDAAALDQLEQMVAAHVGGAVFIAVDPTLRRFRGNERFEDLLRRVGSPMASAPHTAST